MRLMCNNSTVVKWVLAAALSYVLTHVFASISTAAPELSDKVATKHVDVGQMTVKEAEAAIQGERVCIKGKPVSPDSKLQSIELKARDGKAYVHSVSLPIRVRKQCRMGHDITLEFEGEIRRAPPKTVPFGNRLYAADTIHFAWEVRDRSGAVIEKGESKVVDGKWVETIHPIGPSEDVSESK